MSSISKSILKYSILSKYIIISTTAAMAAWWRGVGRRVGLERCSNTHYRYLTQQFTCSYKVQFMGY